MKAIDDAMIIAAVALAERDETMTVVDALFQMSGLPIHDCNMARIDAETRGLIRYEVVEGDSRDAPVIREWSGHSPPSPKPDEDKTLVYRKAMRTVLTAKDLATAKAAVRHHIEEHVSDSQMNAVSKAKPEDGWKAAVAALIGLVGELSRDFSKLSIHADATFDALRKRVAALEAMAHYHGDDEDPIHDEESEQDGS